MMAVSPTDFGMDAKLVYEISRDIMLVVAFVYFGWQRSKAASKIEIEEVKKAHGERLDRHSEKLTQHEERMKAMPKHDDLENLHERINRTNDNVSEVKVLSAGIKATVDAIKNSVALLNRSHIKDD